MGTVRYLDFQISVRIGGAVDSFSAVHPVGKFLFGKRISGFVGDADGRGVIARLISAAAKKNPFLCAGVGGYGSVGQAFFQISLDDLQLTSGLSVFFQGTQHGVIVAAAHDVVVADHQKLGGAVIPGKRRILSVKSDGRDPASGLRIRIIFHSKAGDLKKAAGITALQQHAGFRVLSVQHTGGYLHDLVQNLRRDLLQVEGVGIGESGDQIAYGNGTVGGTCPDASGIFHGNNGKIPVFSASGCGREAFCRVAHGIGSQISKVGFHDTGDGNDTHIAAPEGGFKLPQLFLQKRGMGIFHLLKFPGHLLFGGDAHGSQIFSRKQLIRGRCFPAGKGQGQFAYSVHITPGLRNKDTVDQGVFLGVAVTVDDHVYFVLIIAGQGICQSLAGAGSVRISHMADGDDGVYVFCLQLVDFLLGGFQLIGKFQAADPVGVGGSGGLCRGQTEKSDPKSVPFNDGVTSAAAFLYTGEQKLSVLIDIGCQNGETGLGYIGQKLSGTEIKFVISGSHQVVSCQVHQLDHVGAFREGCQRQALSGVSRIHQNGSRGGVLETGHLIDGDRTVGEVAVGIVGVIDHQLTGGLGNCLIRGIRGKNASGISQDKESGKKYGG